MQLTNQNDGPDDIVGAFKDHRSLALERCPSSLLRHPVNPAPFRLAMGQPYRDIDPDSSCPRQVWQRGRARPSRQQAMVHRDNVRAALDAAGGSIEVNRAALEASTASPTHCKMRASSRAAHMGPAWQRFRCLAGHHYAIHRQLANMGIKLRFREQVERRKTGIRKLPERKTFQNSHCSPAQKDSRAHGAVMRPPRTALRHRKMRPDCITFVVGQREVSAVISGAPEVYAAETVPGVSGAELTAWSSSCGASVVDRHRMAAHFLRSDAAPSVVSALAVHFNWYFAWCRTQVVTTRYLSIVQQTPSGFQHRNIWLVSKLLELRKGIRCKKRLIR